MKNRLLALLFCTAMLAGILPGAALAEATWLSLTVTGKTALGDGSWEEQPLTVDFLAEQNGTTVGTLTADGESTISCGGGDLILYPVAETVPEGWRFEAAYLVRPQEGALNRAAIQVTADAGLFEVTAEPGAVFTLTSAAAAEGEAEPMSFTADETGRIVPESALPAGDYILQDAEGRFQPLLITIVPYTGAPEDVFRLDATAAALVPEPVDVSLALTGDSGAEMHIRFSREGSRIDAYLTAGETAPVSLTPGEWAMTLEVPAGHYLVCQDQIVTGTETMAFAVSGAASLSLALHAMGAVEAALPLADGAPVTLTGESLSYAGAVEAGSLRIPDVMPGDYTAAVVLPHGQFEGEGWTVADAVMLVRK